MNSKDVKQIRGQIRIVVKELLPELLKGELATAINNDLARLVNARLDAITKHVEQSLKVMDERSKDIQTYLIRNTAPQAPKPAEAAPATELQ